MKTKRYVLHLTLLTVCLAALPACTSTITPDPITATQASFDGKDQHSGVIALADGGFIVTPRWAARYNQVIQRFASSWVPAIAVDHGLTARGDGNYFVTNEGMEKAIVMFAWQRMDRASRASE